MDTCPACDRPSLDRVELAQDATAPAIDGSYPLAGDELNVCGDCGALVPIPWPPAATVGTPPPPRARSRRPKPKRPTTRKGGS